MQKRVFLIILVLSLFLLTSCTIEEPKNMITGDFRFIDLFTRNTLECSDSDGGINLNQKGTTILMKKNANHPEELKKDYCTRSGKLVEFYCSRNEIKTIIESCGDGNCVEGQCIDVQRINTLVIVNSDDFPSLTIDKVKEHFQMAENYWLFPKTQVRFNITDIKYYALAQKDWKLWLTEDLLKGYKTYPEYIVIYQNDPTYAGYQSQYELESFLNFYEFDDEIIYCSKFKHFLDESMGIVIPAGIVNYGFKYSRCGYGEDGETVVSNVSINGQCINKEGIPCVWKNGYQMCPDKVDSFFAQNPPLFPAKTIVHELLHSYADDEITLEHFSQVCGNNKLGWDSEYGWDYYMKTLEAGSFDDIAQEYATICPYVWQQFINSQQVCPK